MSNEIIYIYIHKNKINGKVYIGQTNNYKRRWKSNGSEYKPKINNSSRFWNAIEKYGWNNFEHIIVATCLSREEANQKEIELIKEYNSCNPEYGYNIAEGGTTPNYWNSLSEEEKEEKKEQCSKRSKILWQDPKYVQKQQEGMKKVMATEEYRQKMSNSLKKIWDIQENRDRQKEKMRAVKGIPVMCLETQQIFNSISAANEYFHKSTRCTAIHDFFRGKTKTAFGYTWKKLTQEEYICLQQLDGTKEEEQ